MKTKKKKIAPPKLNREERRRMFKFMRPNKQRHLTKAEARMAMVAKLYGKGK